MIFIDFLKNYCFQTCFFDVHDRNCNYELQVPAIRKIRQSALLLNHTNYAQVLNIKQKRTSRNGRKLCWRAGGRASWFLPRHLTGMYLGLRKYNLDRRTARLLKFSSEGWAPVLGSFGLSRGPIRGKMEFWTLWGVSEFRRGRWHWRSCLGVRQSCRRLHWARPRS